VFAHDFDDAHEWMASIPHSYGKAVGEQFDGATSAGRVCELNDDPNGLKASEQFLDYDEKSKTCTIRVDFVNTPRLFPIHHNELTFSVTESGSGSCETTWAVRSQLKPHGSSARIEAVVSVVMKTLFLLRALWTVRSTCD
jgi:hypothetical protein